MSCLLLQLVLFSVRAFAVQHRSQNLRKPGSLSQNWTRPNILFIVSDDLNVNSKAQTPHLDKIGASGVVFTNAMATHPLCAPSRTSFMFGIHGTKSKLMYGRGRKRESYPVLANSKHLVEYLAENGYYTYGTGKVSYAGAPPKESAWTLWGYNENHGPFPLDYTHQNFTAHPSLPQPLFELGLFGLSFGRFSDMPYGMGVYSEGNNIGGPKVTFKYIDSTNHDATPDQNNANFAVEQIQKLEQTPNLRPFFLAVGFNRPHVPMYCSDGYYNLYPLKSMALPPMVEHDTDDIFFESEMLEDQFNRTVKSYGRDEGLKRVVQAYYACVTEVDTLIGKVVQALDDTSMKDNTIVIITGDNGWHLGQKNLISKPTPYDESVAVPLIIRAPGVMPVPGGRKEDHPVSLLDLYPTIIDLCSLQGDTMINNKGLPLDGRSLRPFLSAPGSNVDVSGYPSGVVSVIPTWTDETAPIFDKTGLATLLVMTVRTQEFRYILYPDGSEELYDQRSDGHEWNNIANSLHPDLQTTKRYLRKMLMSELDINLN